MSEQEDDIELSVIDAEEVEKLQKKKKKIQRVKEVIRENGLEHDQEFMKEIDDLIKWLLKEE